MERQGEKAVLQETFDSSGFSRPSSERIRLCYKKRDKNRLFRPELAVSSAPKASEFGGINTEFGQFVNMVALDMDAYAEKYGSKAVKKTLTIPAWLNTYVEENNISCSAVLQETLSKMASPSVYRIRNHPDRHRNRYNDHFHSPTPVPHDPPGPAPCICQAGYHLVHLFDHWISSLHSEIISLLDYRKSMCLLMNSPYISRMVFQFIHPICFTKIGRAHV